MLAQLIGDLSAIEPERRIRFDFGLFVPDGLDSYRGYYEDLAIGYTEIDAVHIPPTVRAFSALLKSRLGTTMTGWKGGTYRIQPTTKLWVANPGDATGTEVAGVIVSHGEVIIETRHEGFDE